MITRPVLSSQAHVRSRNALAADLLPRRALGDQLLLDHVLGRDAGVVVAGLPERVEAAHAVPADQAVLHRAVERVAHVELAGDVRRRHADHERLVAPRAGAGPVEALGLPELLPARLDPVRVVPRIHPGRALGVHQANLDDTTAGKSGGAAPRPPATSVDRKR